jgi:competence protein ComEC
VVVLTHPEQDHFGGLVEIFRRYKVDYFLANDLTSSDQGYQVLTKEVGGSGVKIVNPASNLKVGNSLIYLDILYPSKNFLNDNLEVIKDKKQKDFLNDYQSKENKNLFSIVSVLHFGNFSALFPGDIEEAGENEIINIYENLNVDYLKVPYHGSKNGLTEDFLKYISPSVAVISVGEKNSFGHPNKEILDLLNKYNIRIFRTDKDGDVEFISDGKGWKIKK